MTCTKLVCLYVLGEDIEVTLGKCPSSLEDEGEAGLVTLALVFPLAVCIFIL